MSEAFEVMLEGEDGWSDWVHPLPGYRMKCCDCGLVHDMEFAIVEPNGDEAALNDGENGGGVIVFRARRGAANPERAGLITELRLAMQRDFNLSFYRDGSVQEDLGPLLAWAARALSGEQR